MELQLSVLHQRPVPGRPVHHRVRAGSVLSRRQVHDISSAESLLLEILTLTRCACVFSDFLGRTEVPVATIKKDQDGKGPLTRRLLLHEVPTGEVRVRLDLQLYEQTPFFWPRICRMKQLLFFFSLIKKPISPLGEQTDRTRERVRSRLRGTGEKRLNSLVQRLAAGQKVDPNQVLTQHDREVENLTWLSI